MHYLQIIKVSNLLMEFSNPLVKNIALSSNFNTTHLFFFIKLHCYTICFINYLIWLKKANRPNYLYNFIKQIKNNFYLSLLWQEHTWHHFNQKYTWRLSYPSFFSSGIFSGWNNITRVHYYNATLKQFSYLFNFPVYQDCILLFVAASPWFNQYIASGH